MQTEPGHEDGAKDGEAQPDVIAGYRVAHRLEAERHRETQENKPDYLIPKGSCRLHDGGTHMPDKFPAMPDILSSVLDGYTLPHDFMVTKGS